jgi:hypothetical protein
VSLCRASRVCCCRGVKILPRGLTTRPGLKGKKFIFASKGRCFHSKLGPLPSRTHHRATHTIKIQACTSLKWRTVATQAVLGPSREARDCVRACGAVHTIIAGPSTRRWRVRDSPASFMTRGCQCCKAYYIVFVNARFMYMAWELSTLRLSNVETWSTSWSLRVSQARPLHRVTKIRIDPTLLSESMASLMDGSLTTSRARVQCRSSAMYRQKQLRQAGAGAAGGGGSEEKLCNEE